MGQFQYLACSTNSKVQEGGKLGCVAVEDGFFYLDNLNREELKKELVGAKSALADAQAEVDAIERRLKVEG